MKKLLLSIAAVAMLALTSCQSETDYKAKGAEMARQLNELCDKQDGEAALALEKQIEKEEAAVIAKGDSAAIVDFKEAVKESKQRNTPFISAAKIKSGVSKEDVAKELEQAALNREISMDILTASINAIVEAEEEVKKGESKE